eukprot:gene2655-3612_t
MADGPRIEAPLWWYPRLQAASPEQRDRWEILPFGDAVGWEDIDEYISAKTLIIGDAASGANWVYGGFLAGILILCLAPLILRGWSWPMIAVFLQLPAYMLHQFEEHDADRFGRFVNQVIGGGREVLSAAAIFVINVPGVWGVNVISIWLATSQGIGFGLIGIYLTLVNALVHIMPTVRLRRYNPGLVTGMILFLPLGIWALVLVSAQPGVSVVHHVVGLVLAIAIHLAIIAYVLRNRGRALQEGPT